MGCTTILVGKKASLDGSTIVARTEDSASGSFDAKKFIIVKPEDQPKKYKSVISKVEIDLPDKALQYTACPNAVDTEGIWACAGINEKNVGMTATETLTSNERVLSADPLFEGGIGEEDIVTLVLPYIYSAREGVNRLGSLLEKYGTYEMNGIAFHDEDEIWWFETIGGHHWIAKRLRDDSYSVIPNQLSIDNFNLDDAFSDKRDHMCSEDLLEFIEENHLNAELDIDYGPFPGLDEDMEYKGFFDDDDDIDEDDEIIDDEFGDDNFEYDSSLGLEDETHMINPRLCFGSDTDADKVYNTPRAWVIQRFFNRRSNIWDGVDADYRPDSNDIPWERIPDKKISIEDIKYALSHHYQGTKYDVYLPKNQGDLRFRPIGINRNNILVLTQIRGYMPEKIKSLQWMAFGSTTFNAIIPQYANVDTSPGYLREISARVTSENFYWANRIIGPLAEYRLKENASNIERYQNKLQAKTLELVKKTDKKLKSKIDEFSNEDVKETLEKTNQEIADIAKFETDDLLDKVLYQTSLLMKNGFSRSDS